MANRVKDERIAQLADRVVAICEDRFADQWPIGHADEISPVVGVDLHWQPEIWCDDNADCLDDIFRLTKSVAAPAAAIIAAAAMLQSNPFELARVWSRTFQWHDLTVIAAAACQRLPETS